MRKNKIAQLKIQQMSFMLLAIVLFFILVGLFYLALKTRGLQDSAGELAQEKTIGIISRIADSAEFYCGENRELCIDSDKLIVMKNRKGYRYLWPSDMESLSVEKVFPVGEKIECTSDNYPNCNEFIVFESEKDQLYISSFVSLCRKDFSNNYAYDKCEIARVVAGVKKE